MERQAQLARRSKSTRQYYVIDEAVVRRHVGIKRDPAIMPEQLRHIADRAENDELITVQVIPFGEGAHPGLSGSFTLLEFDGPLSALLYLDAERKISLLTGSDERVARYVDDFELMVETALPATQSVDFLRQAAEEMSRPRYALR